MSDSTELGLFGLLPYEIRAQIWRDLPLPGLPLLRASRAIQADVYSVMDIEFKIDHSGVINRFIPWRVRQPPPIKPALFCFDVIQDHSGARRAAQRCMRLPFHSVHSIKLSIDPPTKTNFASFLRVYNSVVWVVELLRRARGADVLSKVSIVLSERGIDLDGDVWLLCWNKPHADFEHFVFACSCTMTPTRASSHPRKAEDVSDVQRILQALRRLPRMRTMDITFPNDVFRQSVRWPEVEAAMKDLKACVARDNKMKVIMKLEQDQQFILAYYDMRLCVERDVGRKTLRFERLANWTVYYENISRARLASIIEKTRPAEASWPCTAIKKLEEERELAKLYNPLGAAMSFLFPNRYGYSEYDKSITQVRRHFQYGTNNPGVELWKSEAWFYWRLPDGWQVHEADSAEHARILHKLQAMPRDFAKTNGDEAPWPRGGLH